MKSADYIRPMGCIPPVSDSTLEPRFQQILEEREAAHRRVLIEHEHRYGHVVVAFSGPASFGLITDVAKTLEADGKTIYAHWHRDALGIINGVDIVELAEVNGR